MGKQESLTPAEQEKERKRRDAAWWKKVITYYLNQMYHEELDPAERQYRTEPLIVYMAGYIREQRLLDKLREKKPGQLSAIELLEKMEKYQEEDSPFRTLLHDLKESPEDEKKIAESVTRCVEEAPQRILNRGRRNAVHIKMPAKKETGEPEKPEQQPEIDPEEAERTRYEMTLLRGLMPQQLYLKLCEGLIEQGRMKDPETEFLFEPEEKPGPTYEEYVAQHKTDPKEREGELGNMDDIFTSAAYVLAAYEQRKSPWFDEKKADARAMQLSGSKAFRAFVKSHPGSLLAAAGNTGVGATYRELTALEKKLKAQDEALTPIRAAMRARATGKTAAYHQMMNALNRFAASDDPSPKEKDALRMKLAGFIMTDGNPGSQHYNREDCLLAAGAMKVLLSKKEFDTFLTAANAVRPPDEKLHMEELDAVLADPAPHAPERTGPILERNPEQ